MGKRSNFERHPRGLYPTPESAVRPLLLHLPSAVCFDAPCAGDGALVRHLEAEGHSLGATSDIQPMAAGIATSDARGIERCTGEMFITNPPWPEPNRRGDPTLSILMHLSSLAPTWLLLPADFAHNIYFHKVADRCRKIVSVGRVKWIPGTRGPGKDNAARYLFDEARDGRTHFYGRSEPPPAALETGRLHTNAEQYCSAKQPYKGKVMKLEQNQKEKAFYECIRPHVENVVANEFGIVFENLLAPGDLYDHIIEQIMHDLCLAARRTDMPPNCEALVPIIDSHAFSNCITEEVDEMANAAMTTLIKHNYGALLEHPDYVHRKGGGD